MAMVIPSFSTAPKERPIEDDKKIYPLASG